MRVNSMRCSGGLTAAQVRLAEALSRAREEEVTAGRRHSGSNVAVGRRDGSFTHVLGGGEVFYCSCCNNPLNISRGEFGNSQWLVGNIKSDGD